MILPIFEELYFRAFLPVAHAREVRIIGYARAYKVSIHIDD
jgi:hypothetical protein